MILSRQFVPPNKTSSGMISILYLSITYVLISEQLSAPINTIDVNCDEFNHFGLEPVFFTEIQQHGDAKRDENGAGDEEAVCGLRARNVYEIHTESTGNKGKG